MVWSLGLLLYQGVTGRKLFSPRLKHALAQMSAIQAVLGSPPEPVMKEWLKRPNRQCMLSGVPESPSILVDELNAGFPPGTERPSGLIRHMLEYDLKERWTPEDCLQM
jgi:serine/threonine protein kinase